MTDATLNMFDDLSGEEVEKDKPTLEMFDDKPTLDMFDSVEGQTTGGSNVEPTEDKFQPQGALSLAFDDLVGAGKDLGNKYLDVVKKRIDKINTDPLGMFKVGVADLEATADLGLSAISWLPSKIAPEINNVLAQSLIADSKATGKEVPAALDPKNIARKSKEIEEAIGGFLPGLTPGRTELGAEQTELIGSAFEKLAHPIKVAQDFYSEAGWPNAARTLGFFAELLMFKGIHKTGVKGVEIIKDVKSKISGVKTEAELTARLKEASDKLTEDMTPEEVVEVKTKSELSQKSKGFEGDPVRKPDLGEEPKSGMGEVVQPELTPKPKVTFLSEEGIPRATYQVENGKIKTVEKIGEKKTYKKNPASGKIELVEEIPGEKSVYQITLDPLKNKRGSVDVKGMAELFGKAPKGLSLLSRLGKAGINQNDLMLSGLHQYLKDTGNKKIDWDKFKKVADEGGFDVSKDSSSLLDRKINRSYEEIVTDLDTAIQEGKVSREKADQYLRGEIAVFDPVYGPENHPQYNLAGHREGTYSENLYKYEPQDINIPDWQESHWGKDRANVMAHERGHDRIVGDKDVRYVDEVQSKWHDQGRQQGYGDQVKIEGVTKLEPNLYEILFDNGATIEITAKSKVEAKTKAFKEALESGVTGILGIPNAPFKKTWPQMIMRDVIADAVSRGKEGIAWSTGKIQQKRWPGAKTDYASLYDKKIKKFMEKESGVKAEKVETKTDGKINYELVELPDGQWTVVDIQNRDNMGTYRNSVQAHRARNKLEKLSIDKTEQVWYVPLTPKLKKLYFDNTASRDAIDMLLAPLRNETGSITIPKSAKELREKTSEAFRENARRFERLAKESGKDFDTFLKENNFSKKEIRQIKKVSTVVKKDRPFKAVESSDVISTGKDPLKPQPGEVNVNVHKEANPKTFIGSKFFEGIKTAKETVLPSIMKAFTPSIHMIKDMKSSQMLDMWHKVKAIEGNRIKDVNILKDTVIELRDQYPKRKLREEAFIKIMSADPLGLEALKMLEIEPIKGEIKYEGLVTELEGHFKDLFNQLNEMRNSIGKTKIAERASYLPMIAQENFYSQMGKMFKGEKGEIKNPNMVLDSVQAIKDRHAPGTVEATNLRHLKRRGLRRGVKLETDPLKLLSQYGSTAYKHIHYSPFNMFVNQLTGNKFKVTNSKGKTYDWQMKNQKPELHEFLSRWSNSLAGMPNVVHGPSLRFLETGVQKLSKNLTAAVLGWSARTILVQPTALLPTMSEFGITPTIKGLVRTATRSGKDPINLSEELPNRKSDAFINDSVSNKLKGPVGRVLSLPKEKALSAMQFVDYIAAEATWRTAYEQSKHLGKEAAARLADEAVVRTQGSGFVGDLSPIQMNALGKAVTLWQTYTINHMNWIGREVLNIKHPERSPVETARRVLTYTIGTAIINNIFEDQIGIQSPQPAPIKEFIKAMKRGDTSAAVAYQGLRELTELMPLMSSLKFGSSPAGAVAEFLKELSQAAADDLPRALNGDKKAMKRVGFVAAKLWGVPGTQQIKRFDQGTPLGFPIKEATGKRRKRTSRKRKSRKRKR